MSFRIKRNLRVDKNVYLRTFYYVLYDYELFFARHIIIVTAVISLLIVEHVNRLPIIYNRIHRTIEASRTQSK